MTCCRCNRTGTSKNCACAKSGNQCLSCLPSRLGKCQNSILCTAPLRSQDVGCPPPVTNSPLHISPALAPQRVQQSSPQITPLNDHPVCVELQPLSSSPTTNANDSNLLFPDLSSQSFTITTPQLPVVTPVASPSFTLGQLDATSFIKIISEAYEETVHWRRNLFMIPTGNPGKRFVSELASLFRAYAEGSALECIALKATTVLAILALQKLHQKSKSKDHTTKVALKDG